MLLARDDCPASAAQLVQFGALLMYAVHAAAPGILYAHASWSQLAISGDGALVSAIF